MNLLFFLEFKCMESLFDDYGARKDQQERGEGEIGGKGYFVSRKIRELKILALRYD